MAPKREPNPPTDAGLARAYPEQAGPSVGRRPYRRPEITFHERLEVFATVCTPGKADPVTCPNGPIAS